MNKGSLELICGCMFSGKTEELLRRVRLAKIAKQNVQIFKPHRDKKTPGGAIKSRSGALSEAIIIPPTIENGVFSSSQELFNQINLKTEVVAIDEVQFFDKDIVEVCERLANSGKRIIVAGLALDFRGEPFGEHILSLLAKADELSMLTAICVVCGGTATRTQRLVDGKPAKWDEPIYMVGGHDNYKAVCRAHHQIVRPPNYKIRKYSVLPFPNQNYEQ